MSNDNNTVDDEIEFAVSSIYGVMTKQGLVVIQFGEQQTQVTVAQAREMAMGLLEGAEAAEGDAAFVCALERIGMKPPQVAQMLMMLREERERLRSP